MSYANVGNDVSSESLPHLLFRSSEEVRYRRSVIIPIMGFVTCVSRLAEVPRQRLNAKGVDGRASSAYGIHRREKRELPLSGSISIHYDTLYVHPLNTANKHSFHDS